MIFGIGTDLADLKRIRAAFERFGARFRGRVFTPAEIDFCEGMADKYASYAARFAAKEAFSKALGTGLRGLVSWRDIQVNDNERSRPTITTYGRARQLLGNRRVHVSLSHTGEYATAVVVIEDRPAD